jgi:hypothetical protein
MMKRLPEKFTKYREQFELICRTAKTAIYLRHINGRQKSYEVIVIRVADRKAVKSAGKVQFVECESYECYPSSETWGRCGWTYTTEEDARAKYDLLNDPSYKLPAPPLYPIRLRARDGILQERVLPGRSTKTAGTNSRDQLGATLANK